MNENILKVIQAGVGGMGYNWLKTIKKMKDFVKPVAYVDVNRRNLEYAAKTIPNPNGKYYIDLDKALRETSADVLIDITPQKYREETVIKAFKRGLDVLCEKPLSENLESAKRIVNSARKHKRRLMISQNFRFKSGARTIKNILNKKAIGKISYVNIEFYKGFDFGKNNWRSKMENPLILDMAIHHFDLLRFFLGTDGETVYARSRNYIWSWYKGDPVANVSIEMKNGVLIGYNASWINMGEETTWNGNWRIEGSKGGIYWRNDHVFLYTRQKGLKEIKIQPVKYEGIAYSLFEFCNSIKENRPPETEGKDNIKSLEIVFACIKSIRENRAVRIKY